MQNNQIQKAMKCYMFLFLLIAAAFVSCSDQAPKSPQITVEGKDIKVVYGQPSKRDRVIFGELVPYGQVWRAGANEATEITFSKDASFAGQPVKAGVYSFFVIPNTDNWTVILNTKLKQWGAFSYDNIKEFNVMEGLVPAMKTDSVVEKLTYSFADDNSKMIVSWDETKAEIPIEN